MAVIDLKDFENKVYSQNGEDGVIQKIFELIGTTNKYYVEFGVESGTECNTRLLKEQHSWNGLLMDGSHENLALNLQKEFITAENINDLFEKHKVPFEFDLLSIDIDYNDFHVWNAISSSYRPRVVVIEYNAEHPPPLDKVCKYDSSYSWDSTTYFGASIKAMQLLGASKGYSLVYADKKGVNLFFIHKNLVRNLENKNKQILNTDDCDKLYNPPAYGHGLNNGHYYDHHQRSYTSFSNLIQ